MLIIILQSWFFNQLSFISLIFFCPSILHCKSCLGLPDHLDHKLLGLKETTVYEPKRATEIDLIHRILHDTHHNSCTAFHNFTGFVIYARAEITTPIFIGRVFGRKRPNSLLR